METVIKTMIALYTRILIQMLLSPNNRPSKALQSDNYCTQSLKDFA